MNLNHIPSLIQHTDLLQKKIERKVRKHDIMDCFSMRLSTYLGNTALYVKMFNPNRIPCRFYSFLYRTILRLKLHGVYLFIYNHSKTEICRGAYFFFNYWPNGTLESNYCEESHYKLPANLKYFHSLICRQPVETCSCRCPSLPY